MVIELLKFKVAPDLREDFIQKNAQIWTTAPAEYPEFIGKELWCSPNDYTEVILIIRWATRQQWKALPQEDLQTIEDKFIPALGESYPYSGVSRVSSTEIPHF